MEELRNAIRMLEKNFKEVINCNSNNLENLKNYTLELNERVGDIEKTVKGIKDKANDIIGEKIEAVQEDLLDLNTKIESVEEKLQEDIENNAARFDDESSEALKEHCDQSRKLEKLLEENSRKLSEVESNLLLIQKTNTSKGESLFKCEECEQTFINKQGRRKHINQCHPKYIRCDYCDKTFNESWKYETHLESHKVEKNKKCEVCGKAFYLEWRFKQHMNVHTNGNITKLSLLHQQQGVPI